MALGGAVRGAIAAVFGVLVLGATRAQAQDRPVERLVTRDGVRLDYPANGVWRAKGRRVAEARARLRRAGRTDQLNAPLAGARAMSEAAAVSGVLRVPSILLRFRDTDTTLLWQAVSYDSVFYTAQPLTGRPYTVRTLYEEMSNALLRVDGQSLGWVVADSGRSFYLDACGTTANDNAIDCFAGRTRMRLLFEAALSQLDATVDFRQFDNDGPDGIPGSGDDDGYVDVVQFVHPEVGGECPPGRGFWAHKFSMGGLGREYITNDGGVRVSAYHIVAGVGGASCTDPATIMGIGTASHELGHGLGLPDLYDTGNDTEGVGEWCLMGSANFRSLISPGHLSAWSKEQLGWVLVRELAQRGTYSLGPVVLGDTVLLIRPTGANPRGEYFLLENKQAYGSDTANMLNEFCNPSTGRCRPPKGGGLAVWHIDSTKVVTAGFPFANSVNAGLIHGVSLIQADGGNDLETKANRGDDGDPYPGAAQKTTLSRKTTPAALKNADGQFAGVALTNITQVSPGGAVAFDLSFGFYVRASDTLALVRVDGTLHHRFHIDVVDVGTMHRVGIDSLPLTADGRARFEFSSWSDGGPREHDITVTLAEDSLVASVNASYQLLVQIAGGGQVSSAPPFNHQTGEFLPLGTAVTLVATPPTGYVFDGWTGDTTSTSDTLRLNMQRPYTLTANFAPVLVAAAANLPDATMGATYLYQIVATGGTGLYQWQQVTGALPTGMALLLNGALSGTPEETGMFNVLGRVRSGSQTLEVAIVVRVVAPVLSWQAVIAHLVEAAHELTADEIRYLDLLGNGNRRLDVGDFAAWVEKTGVQPSAEVRAALARRTERGR